jgi:hypothetical protein
MADLKSARLMYVKAVLLLLAGLLAAAAVLIELSSWRVAVLMAIAVWSFCRVYYFLFYVIERWIDPGFKFSGIIGALSYVAMKGKACRLAAAEIKALRDA